MVFSVGFYCHSALYTFIAGAKLLGGVFLVCLGLAAGAVLVGASVVILPVLGGIKFHRYLREQEGKNQKKRQGAYLMIIKGYFLSNIHKNLCCGCSL